MAVDLGLLSHAEHMIKNGMVQGLRLQPLMDLHSNQCIGQEVLSQLTIPVFTELFFKYLSAETALSLFLMQAEIVSHRYSGETLLINLPVRTLRDTANLDRLLTSRTDLSRNIGIEIQDPGALQGLSGSERHCLVVTLMVLREEGWKLWIDDLTPALLPEVGSLCVTFDGVKIDRGEIRRRHREPDALSHLVKLARGMGAQVVVEGVESQDDLIHAQQSGADIGQGFYWPETILPLPQQMRIWG
ncbi:EAL domain-containing protein [Pseudocitrobacter faecalis]|uniref:EAL domain-containing protein n=1 Tax=Pseudocitrobacter faecalis TaxID=1398493 RepID=UPI003BA143CB